MLTPGYSSVERGRENEKRIGPKEKGAMNQDFDRERAFLRYRRAVVSEWPEKPMKTVTLAAIDSRLELLQERFNPEFTKALAA
jgi:hypothetical protein